MKLLNWHVFLLEKDTIVVNIKINQPKHAPSWAFFVDNSDFRI